MFFLYQEEHSGLHDLPGQLHQDALFQKDLEDKVLKEHIKPQKLFQPV